MLTKHYILPAEQMDMCLHEWSLIIYNYMFYSHIVYMTAFILGGRQSKKASNNMNALVI